MQMERRRRATSFAAHAACVSYQQSQRNCIIFSCGRTPRVQCVTVDGLPRSFIGVEQAQQVRRDAREMKPDQNTNVQPLAAPTSNCKHALTLLPSTAAPRQHQLSSPVLQLHIMSLVLNAAAANPVFGRRTTRAHFFFFSCSSRITWHSNCRRIS